MFDQASDIPHPRLYSLDNPIPYPSTGSCGIDWNDDQYPLFEVCTSLAACPLFSDDHNTQPIGSKTDYRNEGFEALLRPGHYMHDQDQRIFFAVNDVTQRTYDNTENHSHEYHAHSDSVSDRSESIASQLTDGMHIPTPTPRGGTNESTPFRLDVGSPAITAASARRRSQTLEIRQFGCRYCPSSFTSRANLKGHLNAHLGRKPYACKEHGVAYPYRQCLQRHLRDKHKPVQNLVPVSNRVTDAAVHNTPV